MKKLKASHLGSWVPCIFKQKVCFLITPCQIGPWFLWPFPRGYTGQAKSFYVTVKSLFIPRNKLSYTAQPHFLVSCVHHQGRQSQLPGVPHLLYSFLKSLRSVFKLFTLTNHSKPPLAPFLSRENTSISPKSATQDFSGALSFQSKSLGGSVMTQCCLPIESFHHFDYFGHVGTNQLWLVFNLECKCNQTTWEQPHLLGKILNNNFPWYRSKERTLIQTEGQRCSDGQVLGT